MACRSGPGPLVGNVIGIFDVAANMRFVCVVQRKTPPESDFNYSAGCVIPRGINIASSNDKSTSSRLCLVSIGSAVPYHTTAVPGSDTILFYYIFVPIKLNKRTKRHSPAVSELARGGKDPSPRVSTRRVIPLLTIHKYHSPRLASARRRRRQ